MISAASHNMTLIIYELMSSRFEINNQSININDAELTKSFLKNASAFCNASGMKRELR